MKYCPLWYQHNYCRAYLLELVIVGKFCVCRSITNSWKKNRAVVGWTQQNIVLFCVARFCFFSCMFLHKIPMVLHFTHIGWWGITSTDTLLVTEASEILHTSSSGDGVGVQTIISWMGAWNGCLTDTNQNTYRILATWHCVISLVQHRNPLHNTGYLLESYWICHLSLMYKIQDQPVSTYVLHSPSALTLGTNI